MANKIHPKFGNYYGKLIAADTLEDFKMRGVKDTEQFIVDMKEMGEKNLIFDVENLNDYSDTCFFEVDNDTEIVELMVYLIKLRPDEFNQTSRNCFRIWFD